MTQPGFNQLHRKYTHTKIFFKFKKKISNPLSPSKNKRQLVENLTLSKAALKRQHKLNDTTESRIKVHEAKIDPNAHLLLQQKKIFFGTRINIRKSENYNSSPATNHNTDLQKGISCCSRHEMNY